MLISTILLIANLIALVFMDGAFMSFWWNAGIYVNENCSLCFDLDINDVYNV